MPRATEVVQMSDSVIPTRPVRRSFPTRQPRLERRSLHGTLAAAQELLEVAAQHDELPDHLLAVVSTLGRVTLSVRKHLPLSPVVALIDTTGELVSETRGAR